MAHMHRFVVARSHKEAEMLFAQNPAVGWLSPVEAEQERECAELEAEPGQPRLQVVKLLISVTATGREA